ncbi:YaaC family protein [Metabacillus sp. FJAT-53654]|uniref:YaaC family protein n=1 Tax=Metabacillus rhizosphaerae TaxID=3117747 RepID=A0ABZ2MVE3_9BACI
MNTQVWERLLSYHSTETVQKKLEKTYEKFLYENSKKLEYDNCLRFVYFLKHGENFFTQANQSPPAIQPMLLFYGISQLIKACLIIIDPEYPSTSSVLAHGVSSRKRKKQQYHFLEDEIKIQRNGLFSHVANKIFQINHLEAEKYSMELLLKQIAEMNEVFSFHHSQKTSVLVDQDHDQFLITESVAQLFHMSPKRLAEFLEERYLFEFDKSNTEGIVLLKSVNSMATYNCMPFSYHLEEGNFYLPTSREVLLKIPELLVHYLLLYNLSMISRYETEWWYELLLGASNDDYPFILRYMEIAKRKIPYFILNFLEHNLK